MFREAYMVKRNVFLKHLQATEIGYLDICNAGFLTNVTVIMRPVYVVGFD